MLVLSRKKSETILIDGHIEIQVVQIQGNKVRIGVKAPQDVRILRGELKPFGMAEDEIDEETKFHSEILAYTAQAG